MSNKENERGSQKRRDEKFKLCPCCGNFAGFGENERYCIVCGEKLIEACPSCREPIFYPTAKFCPVCGEKYGGES